MIATEKPDEREVRAQLARVLASPEFRDAPVLTRMLQSIVDSGLEGTASTLNASSLARIALGRGPEFRSSQDSSVRVAANRLRRALKLYFSQANTLDDVEILLNPGSFAPVFRYRLAMQPVCGCTRALRAFDHYQNTATRASLAAALDLVEAAVSQQPDSAPLQAARAELLMDAFKHGYSSDEKVLDEAQTALEEAQQLDEQHQAVWSASAMWEMLHGNTGTVQQLAHDLCSTAVDQSDRAFGIWFLTVIGDQPVQRCADNKELFSQADVPSWIHHAPFLEAYNLGDYEAALTSAIAFGMPDFFWGNLDRAASLSQLGLYTAAKIELRSAVEKCPALLTAPDPILATYVQRDEHRQHVIEGLEKAGLRSIN